MDAIRNLWDKIQSEPSGKHYFEQEIEGIDLIEIDMYLVRAIKTFLSNNGSLEPKRIEEVRICKAALEEIAADVNEESKTYFNLMWEISGLIINEVEDVS